MKYKHQCIECIVLDIIYANEVILCKFDNLCKLHVMSLSNVALYLDLDSFSEFSEVALGRHLLWVVLHWY